MPPPSTEYLLRLTPPTTDPHCSYALALDEGGETESDAEVVNALLRDPVRIEYFARSASTGQRVDWKAPLSSCVAAINLTVDRARAAHE